MRYLHEGTSRLALLTILGAALAVPGAHAAEGPTEDSLWYYEIGGAEPVSAPANPSVVSVTLGGAAQQPILAPVAVVAERLLVGLGALVALAGFLLCALLPRLGRLSAVALVLVALAAATALPLLWPQATTTALLNAFAFGVLAALPVLALGALARSWEAGPFSRLKAALTELRQAS